MNCNLYKRLIACVLCAMQLFVCMLPAAYAQTVYYELYNGEELRAAGDGEDFDASIDFILEGLEDGEVGAEKAVYLTSEEDAQQGVVRIEFDVARRNTDPVDVIFVLDRSGTMNMYAKILGSVQHTVPCLNPAHYYRIPYWTEGAETAQYYKLVPTDCGEAIGNWKTESFDKKIVEMIREETGDPTAYLVWDDVMWTCLQEEHYDANGRKIPKPENPDGSSYFSHAHDNVYGCYDRSIMARKLLDEFAHTVLSSNPESRIGYTAFFRGLKEPEDLVFLKSEVPQRILEDRTGGDYTNYYAGLYGAEKILNARGEVENDRKTYIVFVSDGLPNRDQAKIEAQAQKLRDMGAEIYSVGFFSLATEYLELVASKPVSKYAKDCKTPDQFRTFVSDICETVADNAVMVLDVLGDAYDLYVDDTHPISVLNKGSRPVIDEQYFSLEAAQAAGVEYDDELHQVAWNVRATQAGARLSFYVKLKEGAAAMNGGSGENLPTNEYAVFFYRDERTLIPGSDAGYLRLRKADVPQTGDESLPLGILLLALGAAVGGLALIKKRKGK